MSPRARLEAALTMTYGSSLMDPQSLQGYARLWAIPRAGECRDECKPLCPSELPIQGMWDHVCA